MTDKGMFDKTNGKVKEAVGHITGDNQKKVEGLFDQVVGKVKEATESVKEKTEEVIDNIKK